ncbi:MAG TPA: XRE family transcriptional regulator [Micropepsaceae bacterium]|nr:XRE family transcriptional regulator [Micropepsaceae bacterium]
MAKTLEEVLAALPKARRDRIDARYHELRKEVQSLAALRKAAGKAQVDVATSLKISQPSVSKIERQTDMYLSTLRNYVEAVGGGLELVVRFPRQPPLHLSGLGDFLEPLTDAAPPRGRRTIRSAARRVAKRT